MSPSAIVQKLWNYCNVLRDDGMSYLLARRAQASGDFPSTELGAGPSAELRTGVEQLTYWLFLKMTDERTKGRTKGSGVSRKFGSRLTPRLIHCSILRIAPRIRHRRSSLIGTAITMPAAHTPGAVVIGELVGAPHEATAEKHGPCAGRKVFAGRCRPIVRRLDIQEWMDQW